MRWLLMPFDPFCSKKNGLPVLLFLLKATEQHFPMVLFIMLSIASVDKILKGIIEIKTIKQ